MKYNAKQDSRFIQNSVEINLQNIEQVRRIFHHTLL